MLGLLNGVVGAALLIAGRKLFWLFIGALGFITGVQVTASILHGPDWLLVVIGLILGVIFAALATFLQRLAIVIAGFLSGGYIAMVLAGMFGIEGSPTTWIVYILGGLVGIAIVNFLFDWAIIMLSSLAGAALIIRTFFAHGGNAQLVFFGLFILGVLVQGTLFRIEKREQTERVNAGE